MELICSNKQKHWHSRQHFFQILMGIFLLFVLTPSALAQKTTAEQLSESGVWIQQSLEVITETANVMSAEEMKEIFILAEFETKQELEKFQKTISDWSMNADIKISAIKQKLKELPEPPTIEFSKQMNAIMAERKVRVTETVNKAITTVEKLKTLLIQVSEGDKTGLIEISIVLQDSAQITVQAEIDMIENNLHSVKKSNPAYQFNQFVLYDNKFAIQEIEIDKLDLLGNSTKESRKPIVMKMRKYVSNARRTLPRAHRNLGKMREGLRAEVKRRPLQRKTYESILAMMDIFEPSFVVEEKILLLKDQAIKVYSSDKSSEEIEELTDEIDAKYFKLFDERMRLQNVRMDLIANIGK